MEPLRVGFIELLMFLAESRETAKRLQRKAVALRDGALGGFRCRDWVREDGLEGLDKISRNPLGKTVSVSAER